MNNIRLPWSENSVLNRRERRPIEKIQWLHQSTLIYEHKSGTLELSIVLDLVMKMISPISLDIYQSSRTQSSTGGPSPANSTVIPITDSVVW